MSSFGTALKVLAAGVVLSAAGFAQSTLRVSVKVPHEFHIGSTKLPAGEYIIDGAMGAQYIKFTDRDSRKGVLKMAQSERTGVAGIPYAHVAFRVYGNQHYLASIWSPSSEGRSFPLGAAEREAAKASTTATIALLRAEQR